MSFGVRVRIPSLAPSSYICLEQNLKGCFAVMDTSLLEIAASDIASARKLLIESNDCFIRVAANCVEQAIEKAVKQVLWFYGDPSLDVVDFRELLRLLPGEQEFLTGESLQFLKDYCDKLTDWATTLPYVKSCRATRREVIMFYDFATTLLKEVDTGIKLKLSTHAPSEAGVSRTPRYPRLSVLFAEGY